MSPTLTRQAAAVARLLLMLLSLALAMPKPVGADRCILSNAPRAMRHDAKRRSPHIAGVECRGSTFVSFRVGAPPLISVAIAARVCRA